MPRTSSHHRSGWWLARRSEPAAKRHRLAIGVSLCAGATFVTLGAAGASASTLTPAFLDGHATTLYTESNQVSGNAILAYRAGASALLTPIGSFPTGGTGTGSSPASQGGVTVGDGGLLLAAVNGGSNSVSVFGVAPSGQLQLLETAGSGGTDPISVTIHGRWVYALNAGNATTPPNIGGFLLGSPLPHATTFVRPLNGAASSPEEISFSPDGRDLLVTEKASNTIDVFPVNAFGEAGPAVTTTLAANTGPYGFQFTPQGIAVVSEASYGGLATFSLNPNGTLDQVSQVGDGQLAACWVALSEDGQEAFTSNAHSGTISAYTVTPGGSLTLLPPAVQASPGIADTDLAVGPNSTLYVSDQPNFDASTINPAGGLSPSVIVASGLPAGTFGLATAGGPGIWH